LNNQPIIVALAVCHRDIELAIGWLRWASFLSSQPGGEWEYDLMVTVTKRVGGVGAQRLRGAIDAFPANRIRSKIFGHSDEQESGYPRSASHHFLRTLEHAEAQHPGQPILFCEPDTVITRPSWVREFNDEYQRCGRPFLGLRVGTRAPHLSGNAIYPADWRNRMPSLLRVVEAPDVALWGPGCGQPWDVWCRDDTADMATTRLIHQVWKERDIRETSLKDIPAEAALFHQDKTGSLIRQIAARHYPEFMDSTPAGRRFYQMNGHPTRLSARGHKITFSYQKHKNHGWVSALCDSEIPPNDAAVMAALVGKFGITEITEDQFTALTGRKLGALMAHRKPTSNIDVSHPTVFVMLGRFGDIMNILPILKDEADAGRRPTLVVAQEFASILDGVSYADRIVWEGQYDQLPEALRWLRVSKGIHAPVICQYHRHPTDRARLTDSYQKECWRLAGRIDNFQGRGPLIFDRREPGRENALAVRTSQFDKPVVLVALTSVSSPLADNVKDEVREAITRAAAAADVIDLDDVRADRVYDLLGLYGRAAMLVTVDTMHLHLSRASEIPTVAITNDGWRGSVTNPNTIAAFRYGAIKQNIPALEKAIRDRMPAATAKSKQPTRRQAMTANANNLERVFHVTDGFGTDARHHVAQSTWQAFYREGATPIRVVDYPRDAKSALGDPRPLPFMKDLLSAALEQTTSIYDFVVWTNGDIGIGPGFLAALRAHMETDDGKVGACTMRRTESNGKHHMGRDLFAFRAGWLRYCWEEIPDYVLGAPAFDLGMVALVRRANGCKVPLTLKNMSQDFAPGDMPPGYALHQSHKSDWDVPNNHTHPSVRHNRKLFREWAKQYAPEIKFSPGGNLL
jgi:hypothetical protein